MILSSVYEFLIWNSLTENLSRFAMRSFIKGTTTNAFCEENERERKERRKSEREKERKERLFCDVMERFSVALSLFSVKVFCLVLGEKDMSRISSLKHALEHSFLPLWNTREKEQKEQREREHLNDNISISSKSSVCVSKASFVLHHLHPLKSGRRKRRFGKLRRILSLGQRTMMEKKDDQESQHHRTF